MAWTVEFDDLGGYDATSAGYHINDEKGNRITTVDVHDFLPKGATYYQRTSRNTKAEAAAKLIAAAPELLEEIEYLLNQCRNYDITLPDGAERSLLKVIKKAKGE